MPFDWSQIIFFFLMKEINQRTPWNVTGQKTHLYHTHDGGISHNESDSCLFLWHIMGYATNEEPSLLLVVIPVAPTENVLCWCCYCAHCYSLYEVNVAILTVRTGFWLVNSIGMQCGNYLVRNIKSFIWMFCRACVFLPQNLNPNDLKRLMQTFLFVAIILLFRNKAISSTISKQYTDIQNTII